MRMRPVFLLLTLLACAAPARSFDLPSPGKGGSFAATGAIQLAFTPGDDAAGLVIQVIRGATRQILVQAFSFTHRDIADALVQAAKRGIDVQLIADNEQTFKIEHSSVPRMAKAGVPVFLDSVHVSAHNKVMVIDPGSPNQAVITGSFNFTNSAQYRNAENLLVIRGNPALTDAYVRNWREHREHAEPYR